MKVTMKIFRPRPKKFKGSVGDCRHLRILAKFFSRPAAKVHASCRNFLGASPVEFSSPGPGKFPQSDKNFGTTKVCRFSGLSKGSQSYYEKYFGRRPQKFRAAWEIGNFCGLRPKYFS